MTATNTYIQVVFFNVVEEGKPRVQTRRLFKDGEKLVIDTGYKFARVERINGGYYRCAARETSL